MVYPEFSEVNASEGIQTLFVYSNEVTGGLFTTMTLVSLFIIVLLATFFSARRLKGESDFPASFAVAGFITMLAAIVMTFVENLINLQQIVIAAVVSIIGLVWLFFSDRS